MDTLVLFETPKVHVFSLPPSDFLKSDNWEGNYIWSGALKFVREGNFFAVRLVEKDSNELFGECPIRDENANKESESVQPASDSTRAFVLRVEEGDQFSYVGLLFDDRTIAYNFSSALIHRRKGLGPAPTLPVQDHSLGQNESITVDLFNKVKNTTNEGSSSSATTSAVGTRNDGTIPRVNLFSLEVSTTGKSRRVKVDSLAMAAEAAANPTSSSTSNQSSQQQQQNQEKKTSSPIDDIFGGGSSSSTTSGSPAFPPSSNNNNNRGGAAAADPFGDVFGGGSNNSNNNNNSRPQQQQQAAPASSSTSKDVLDSIFG